MGLLKFGANTLSVDGVPDGHVIVLESELNELKQVRNNYLGLKNSIPAETMGNIREIIEKGQRYDSMFEELTTNKTKVNELSGKLQKLSNIPTDFSVEIWNKDRTREREATRQIKVDALTKQALEKAEREFKVKFQIDPRFIDGKRLGELNVDDAKAADSMYEILNDAHTAQENFIKTVVQKTPPSTGAVGSQEGGNVVNPFNSPIGEGGKNDSVGDGGVIRVTPFGQ